MLASKGCTQARDENNGMLAVHLASEGCTQADEKREQWDAGSPPGVEGLHAGRRREQGLPRASRGLLPGLGK